MKFLLLCLLIPSIAFAGAVGLTRKDDIERQDRDGKFLSATVVYAADLGNGKAWDITVRLGSSDLKNAVNPADPTVYEIMAVSDAKAKAMFSMAKQLLQATATSKRTITAKGGAVP